jgi:hypothetical protein
VFESLLSKPTTSIATKIKNRAILTKGIVAGGAVTSIFTGNLVNDIDIYCNSQQQFKDCVEEAFNKALVCYSVTPKSVTFTGAISDHPIQIMHFKWFKNTEEIFDSFDFTVCMGAVNLETEEYTCHEFFEHHNKKKKLAYNPGTAYPLATGLRALKYLGKGYTIDEIEMLKILTACSMLKLDNWEKYKEQVGGYYGMLSGVHDAGKEFTLENVMTSIVGSFVSPEELEITCYKNTQDVLKRIHEIKNKSSIDYYLEE